MPTAPDRKLVRAIGKWSLTALMVNLIVGSGIFVMPAHVTHLLGVYGPWAYLLAAAGIGLIAACFAEVGSQFAEAGGPYLYARAVFGQFAGIQIAWLAWLVRLTSGAANANIFVEYLAGFLPRAQGRVTRGVVLIILIGGLATINILGVKAGARLSNFLAAAKMMPLVIFVVAGLVLVHHGTSVSEAAVSAVRPGPREWLSAVLLIVFSLSGFETALFPMGEARDARHDAPFALFASLLICTALYTLIQVVVLRALGVGFVGDRSLAEAARIFLGSGGALIVQMGALLSVYGNLSSQILNVPRLTFALAERGDFPSAFGLVSRKFHTPYFSIVTFAVLMFALAVRGTFQGNAVLSAVARLFIYGAVCAAVIPLRRRHPHANAFRLPAGKLISGLGLLFVLIVVAQMGLKDIIAIGGAMLVALLNWMWARRRAA